VCSRCGNENGTTGVISALNHSYGWVVTLPAACGVAGSQKQVCTYCGFENGTTGVISALNHSYGWVVTTPAACGVAGSQKQVCSYCGNENGNTGVISALSHSYSWVVTLPAACGVAGAQKQVCLYCGTEGTSSMITALTHSYSWIATIPNSERRPGKETEICSRCGEQRNERPMTTALTFGTAASATIPAGDYRWYEFTLTADTDIELSVTRSSGNGYLFAYLYNEDFLTHLLSTADYGALSDKALLSNDGKAKLKAGTYYVRFDNSSVSSASGTVRVASITRTVSGVTLSPATANVIRGGTSEFSATVAGTNNPAQTVIWSITQANKHAQTTINTNGVLSVSGNEMLTTLTVRATSAIDSTKYGEATVAISNATISGITVSPSATSVVKGGGNISFSASVAGTNNPPQLVTWSIVETEKHAGTTISASGVLSVSNAEMLTTLTVRATSTYDSSKHGDAAVTLLSNISGVTVSPPTTSVLRGESSTFSATVTGTNDPVQTVTWSIAQNTKQADTTINASGVLTVGVSETLTSLTVRATSTMDNTKYGEATVTIPASVVSGVTVSPSPARFGKGNAYSLSATVSGTNNPPQTVTWSIVETDKHEYTTINASGLLSIDIAETLSSLTVRATSTYDSTKFRDVTVTILTPTVYGVTVSPSTATVVRGLVATFSATFTATANPPQTVTWSIVQTNKHAQTTIDANGVLTVSASETLTSLTVRATSTYDSTKFGDATVTITATGSGTEASPRILTSGTSHSGTVTLNGFYWYAFPVTQGTTYRIWWNDSYQGNSTKTADVIVGARYAGGNIIFGGSGTTWSTGTSVDSGYNTPQTFTATQTGNVYIRVRGYSAGTFSIAFTADNATRPTM